MDASTSIGTVWRSEGQRLFDAYLRENKISNTDAGKAIGITKSAVAHLREGASPRTVTRSAIELWTNGEVPASSWETAKETKFLGTVVPFTPKSKVIVATTEARHSLAA